MRIIVLTLQRGYDVRVKDTIQVLTQSWELEAEGGDRHYSNKQIDI